MCWNYIKYIQKYNKMSVKLHQIYTEISQNIYWNSVKACSNVIKNKFETS